MAMASFNHTVPSPDISDVMNLLCTMKNQNDEAMKEILTKNDEILTKLNSIEEDNQKLRQELLEIKSSLKDKDNGNSLSLRKRNQSEDEVEHENEHSNSIKKARVSVTNLHELDLPASFDSLDDDCLGNVLDFVGKSCYSAFGRVNKRCHEMFCSKGLTKETYLFGYAPLPLIIQKEEWSDTGNISIGVLHYNRMDILEWMFRDVSYSGYDRLKYLCWKGVVESRLDILREVFRRANTQQLEYLRDCNDGSDLCAKAALCGKLECLKLLRENECEWDEETWIWARDEGHDHILQYLQNNGYPTEWQN